jgi:carbon storage regulator
MLVLSRRRDEVIVIGDNVRLTILGISAGKVQLGFEAPRSIGIHRLEAMKTKQTAQLTTGQKGTLCQR